MKVQCAPGVKRLNLYLVTHQAEEPSRLARVVAADRPLAHEVPVTNVGRQAQAVKQRQRRRQRRRRRRQRRRQRRRRRHVFEINVG